MDGYAYGDGLCFIYKLYFEQGIVIVFCGCSMVEPWDLSEPYGILQSPFFYIAVYTTPIGRIC